MSTLKIIICGVAALCLMASSSIAGTVSGLVTDESGAPVSGVTVEVVYQTYNASDLPYGGESIKASATTNGAGRYSISTDGLPPGEFSANAYHAVKNGDRDSNVDFRAEDPSTFAGNTDTVRNFTGGYYESSDENPYGNGGIFVVENAIGDFTDLSDAEVLLINVEKGNSFRRKVRRTGEGLVVTGIPFDNYFAVVSLGSRKLQIRLWGPGEPDEFSDFVSHDFTMGPLGNQFRVAVKP